MKNSLILAGAALGTIVMLAANQFLRAGGFPW